MKSPLRVLLVEDSETDAKLILHTLGRARGGREVEFERVEEASALIAALGRRTWDLVISDWSMPRFGGRDALAIVKAVQPDLPFIIVSGTVGEQNAVEAMRAGAQDYVLKGNLTRLPAAVDRELQEGMTRAAHRRAQEALRESEARYRVLFENSPLPKWLFDVESQRFLAVNDAALRTYGYSREEFLRMTIEDLYPLDDAEATAREIARLGPDSQTDGVRKNRKKDGTLIDVEISGHTLALEGKVARLVVAQDVTERLRAEKALRASEEQLLQAQKMEAIGQLTGGIAHDFNNLLSVILSYSTLIVNDLEEGDPIRKDLLEIKAAGERAASLVRQLLVFSRSQVLEPRVVDLNGIVASTEKMLQRLIGEDIELSAIPAAAPAWVNVDAGQVEQVIMNLAVNARDAMPKGGKLTIEVARIDLDAAYAAAHPGATPGPHFMLSVSDTGAGMDAATQARAFEPFFTTKEKGKGTGLGLSTVFGIVRQSAGTISLYSEQGKGSSFKIYFPAVAKSADTAFSRPAAARVLRGTETILLVEDEEAVRRLARSILQRNGYQVIEAQSGGEAFLICQQERKIDLLLTDVIMPHTSGKQLADWVHTIRPQLRILYMSGYSENTAALHAVLQSEVAFVQKPLAPDALLGKVREVLDAEVPR
jgi:PAS domain S-box-containing protein